MGRIAGEPQHENRSEHRLDDEEREIKRGNYLIALMNAPASMFNTWQQGFIAALTMEERDVDDMIKLLADQPIPRRRSSLTQP